MNASAPTTDKHPHSRAREWALKFLYQCEIEKLYHYSAGHVRRFLEHYELKGQEAIYWEQLVRGVIREMPNLDQQIQAHSKNWSLGRMPVIDRCILRLALYEMQTGNAPRKVIINEAIELAKAFSASESGSFVNGILDQIKPSPQAPS